MTSSPAIRRYEVVSEPRERVSQSSAQNVRARILVVGPNYSPEPTGIAPYTTEICRGLADFGHAVTALTSFPHYPHWDADPNRPAVVTEMEAGVEVRRIRHYVPSNPTNLRRALFEIHFGLGAALQKTGHVDVMICVSPALLSAAMLNLMTMSKPCRPAVGIVVQDLYAAGLSETERGGVGSAAILRKVEGSVIRRADGVAVIHERFRDRIIREFGADPSRMRVIRNWTHTPSVSNFDRDAFRLSMGWKPNETVVMHAGAMGLKQDLANVVRAARLVARDRLPIRFVLMGGGSERSALEQQAKGLPEVAFQDPIPAVDFVRALNAADVLLVNERPGLQDMAVPSKLTSYFSSGRPVLAATTAGSATASEVVLAGAGEVIPPGNPEALVRKVMDLRRDPSRARLLGSQGPRFVSEFLDRGSAMAAYNNWVQDLIDQQRLRGGSCVHV